MNVGPLVVGAKPSLEWSVAHAAGGAQCRCYRCSNRCYQLHNKLQCLMSRAGLAPQPLVSDGFVTATLVAAAGIASGITASPLSGDGSLTSRRC